MALVDKRVKLDGGAWVDYEPAWLEAEYATALFEDLCATLSWEQRPITVYGREVMQPRLITWAGQVPYRYSGQTLDPRPLPPVLSALNKQISEAVGVPFNHVLLNRYRDGKDHMALHSDDEKELGRNPVIAALSLGARRRFVLSPKWNRRYRKVYNLHHGSLLVMGGKIQHSWRHAVPKQANAGERINLTFRLLKGPPGWREPRPPDWDARSA